MEWLHKGHGCISSILQLFVTQDDIQLKLAYPSLTWHVPTSGQKVWVAFCNPLGNVGVHLRIGIIKGVFPIVIGCWCEPRQLGATSVGFPCKILVPPIRGVTQVIVSWLSGLWHIQECVLCIFIGNNYIWLQCRMLPGVQVSYPPTQLCSKLVHFLPPWCFQMKIALLKMFPLSSTSLGAICGIL